MMCSYIYVYDKFSNRRNKIESFDQNKKSLNRCSLLFFFFNFLELFFIQGGLSYLNKKLQRSARYQC